MQTKPDVSAAKRKKMVAEYNAGATLTKLSVNHHLGVPDVRRILVEGGVEIRKKGGTQPFDPDRASQMKKLYDEEGFTLQEVGDRFGLTRERVRQILRANGVESRGRRDRPRREAPLTSEEKKIAKAYDRGTRPADLMAEYEGLTYVSLQSILKRANVEVKPKGFFNRRPDYDKTVTGIIRDYKKGVDTDVIAERYGLCGRTEIYKFLKREGVPVRQTHAEEAE